MVNNLTPICERCGTCCDGYTFWMTNRSYDNDPFEIKRLIEFHGLRTMRNSKGEMGIHIPSKCIQLEIVDGKPFCKIHDTRPGVCRNYFCGKAIERALKKEVANGLHV